jgi:hypothetical protein
MRKKAKNRLLARVAQKRVRVFAGSVAVVRILLEVQFRHHARPV